MTEQSKILVTGATGNVGRQVVSQLPGTGAAIRALARDPDSAGLPDGVEVVRWPYGAAARSLIHERDTAAVAVRALTGDGHGGAKYLLTGPQSLTQVEQVHTIGEAIGRPLRYEEISREVARQELLTVWGDPSFADGALDAWARFVTQPEPVTATVEAVTGAPARTFRAWAIDHADDFR